MSFLVDIVLIGLLIGVVAWNAKKSIFAAGLGALATAIAVVAALFITPLVNQWVATTAVRPIVEQQVANRLADMYSAPHLANGRETVAQLPLEELVQEPSPAFEELLDDYGVTLVKMQAAYALSPQPKTVLTTLTAGLVDSVSRGAVFFVLALLFSALLHGIVHRMEQNLPPLRRYHGIKRILPGAFGVVSGLCWSWMMATVLWWVIPATSGGILFLTPAALEATDWYQVLQWSNPLQFLAPYVMQH